MTGTEIINDVASNIGLSIGAATRVTSTEALQWLNEAYQIAASILARRNLNYYQGTSKSLDTVDGTQSYALESDFLVMKRVEIQYADDEDKVIANPIDMNDIGSTFDAGNDIAAKTNPVYWIWENDLYFSPTPDSSSAAWTTDDGAAITYWYVKQPAALVAGSTPSLPLAYQPALAHYMTAKAFMKLGNANKALIFSNPAGSGLWEMSLKGLAGAETQRDLKKPMSFTVQRGATVRSGIRRP